MIESCWIFDLDNTLIYQPPRNKKIPPQDISLLPYRKEKIHQLLASGSKLAVASNQGGVGLGYITMQQWEAKKNAVWSALGVSRRQLPIYACYLKPKDPDPYHLRKPGPGMLFQAMNHWGYTMFERSRVTFIGDLHTDQQAAQNAKVIFVWASDFFVPGWETQSES